MESRTRRASSGPISQRLAQRSRRQGGWPSSSHPEGDRGPRVRRRPDCFARRRGPRVRDPRRAPTGTPEAAPDPGSGEEKGHCHPPRGGDRRCSALASTCASALGTGADISRARSRHPPAPASRFAAGAAGAHRLRCRAWMPRRDITGSNARPRGSATASAATLVTASRTRCSTRSSSSTPARFRRHDRAGGEPSGIRAR